MGIAFTGVMIRSRKRRRTGYSSQRWPLPRRRNSFIWAQVGFSPTDPQFEYLRAFLTLLARRERPTLGRLAHTLGIRRQTVWQLEQTLCSGFGWSREFTRGDCRAADGLYPFTFPRRS